MSVLPYHTARTVSPAKPKKKNLITDNLGFFAHDQGPTGRTRGCIGGNPLSPPSTLQRKDMNPSRMVSSLGECLGTRLGSLRWGEEKATQPPGTFIVYVQEPHVESILGAVLSRRAGSGWSPKDDASWRTTDRSAWLVICLDTTLRR